MSNPVKVTEEVGIKIGSGCFQ